MVANTSTPIIATNSRTAIHALSQGINVKTTMQPTKIATAIAKLFIACIFMLNDMAFVKSVMQLEKVFIAPETLLKTFPILSNGFEKLRRALLTVFNTFPNITKPPMSTTLATIDLRSASLNISKNLEIISLAVSNTKFKPF